MIVGISGMTRRWTTLATILVAVTLVVGMGGSAVAQEGTPRAASLFPVVQPGDFTDARPYLVAEDPETLEITPILTTGEVVQGTGYQMAGVPSGLGAYQDDDDAVVLMSHALSAEDGKHISDARVSRLVLDEDTAAVQSGSYPVNGSEGYRSLTSAFLAGPEVDVDDPLFLTGEGTTEGEHGGIVLGVDAELGDVTELPWLGRFPHGNAVVLPGFEDQTVILLTDADRLGSEAYLYVADNPQDVLTGKGQLYVFVAGDAQDTADIALGDEFGGRFKPIEETDTEDADALQTATEHAGGFRFVHLGDATADRSDPTTIYLADTGDDADPNIDITSGRPLSSNGRLYRMTLDPTDPTRVTSFQVLLDGDAGDDLRNPNSIDADASTIMIQEDLKGDSRAEDSEDTARILAYDIATGDVTPIARVDQSAGPDRLVDEGEEAGAWASSGIIDVSDLFGPDTWLVTVQAHTLKVPQFDGVDEGGQLLLLRRLAPEVEPTPEEPVALEPTPMPAAPAAPEAPIVVPTATVVPTAVPTEVPTEAPTQVPTAEPTAVPTLPPTVEPTVAPTLPPPVEPTVAPTVALTPEG